MLDIELITVQNLHSALRKLNKVRKNFSLKDNSIYYGLDEIYKIEFSILYTEKVILNQIIKQLESRNRNEVKLIKKYKNIKDGK